MAEMGYSGGVFEERRKVGRMEEQRNGYYSDTRPSSFPTFHPSGFCLAFGNVVKSEKLL
jgi:hypothetical protein